MTTRLPQPIVMVARRDGTLLLAAFAGMAVARPHARRRMSPAESQTRSADDLRRSAQMAAAQAGDRAAYEALLRDCV